MTKFCNRIINGESLEVLKKIPASDDVWMQPFNDSLVHQVVVALLSNKRQGTSNTLRRRDVNYSTAKLRNQKGAGRARVGSRSSHVLGNSVAHGPHPRSYRKKILKKVKKASIRMALSEKMREGTITVINNLNIFAFIFQMIIHANFCTQTIPIRIFMCC